MPTTTYGDISPRTAAYVVKDLLARAIPYMVIEKFGQVYVLPRNMTRSASFRRYFLEGSPGTGTGQGGIGATVLALTPLVEGVTPAGRKLKNVDITVTLQQFGDFVTITDVVEDTHEDPILRQSTEVLAEQAAQTVETLRYNVLKAGTSVRFANGASRAAVNTPITLSVLRKSTRDLKRQNATMITSVVKSTPSYNTQPVEAAYVCLVHPDVENDIRNISGFKHTSQYGAMTPWENEIGSVEDVRFLKSTLFTPFADAGGAATTVVLSTSGTSADVYPLLLLGKNAYGMVPLKGANSIVPMVVNSSPAAGNPLGQRGTVGWKTYHATVILNDAWMTRIEVAASV